MALVLGVQGLAGLEVPAFKMAEVKPSYFVDIEQVLIAIEQVLKAGKVSGTIAGTAVVWSSADCIA